VGEAPLENRCSGRWLGTGDGRAASGHALS
jgi:hypothetical protein